MLEFLEVQEEYIKDEQRNLKKEYLHAQEEVKRIQSVPLVIGQFLEAVDQNTGIGLHWLVNSDKIEEIAWFFLFLSGYKIVIDLQKYVPAFCKKFFYLLHKNNDIMFLFHSWQYYRL